MKKSGNLLQEMEASHKFYGIKSFENQEFLLFVTRSKDLKIVGTNLMIGQYFGIEPNDAQENGNDFYKKILHPDQYADFLLHLKSCKDLAKGEEKEIKVHLKSRNGNWQKFLFQHRPYSQKGKNLILGVAKKIEDPKIERQIKSILNPEVEKKMQENSSKYKILLNSIDDAFCCIEMIFDLEKKPMDYLFVETNPAFDKHVGLSSVEGKTMRELRPDHEEHWFETYGNVALMGKPIRFQDFAEGLENSWFDVYAFPMGQKESQKVALLFSNITEQKLAETNLKENHELLEQKIHQRTKELKENSELLQTIFDTTHEGVVVFKPIYDEAGELVDFLYVRVNKIIIDQYNQGQLVGQRYFEVNPDAAEMGVFDDFKHTMLTGEPKDFEILYDRNGHNNWFRITARRQNELLITSREDITKRQLEAQRLKENIRFRKQLTKASPDIIMIFNLYDESIRYINRDMSPQPGMKEKDILGMSLLKLVPFIHPQDREKAMEFHEKIINASDRDITEIELRVKSKKKTWEWFSAIGKVFMRNRKANVYEYMVLLRNIDQQKITQKALINAEKLSIKGEVARTLAHELRNPLASIGMTADILLKKMSKKEDAQIENYIGVIKRSTKILNNLVTDLLTASNYSAVDLKKHCLAEILEEALKLAGDRIYLTGIKVNKDYKGHYYINADDEKLKIALLNIIVNASEAMDPDEGILDLIIKKSKDDYVLTVKDNGCGLEKDQLDRLFEAFYSQKAQGIGVGLSSVKNILEEHDAKIEVDSELNQGTIFKLCFHCYENI